MKKVYVIAALAISLAGCKTVPTELVKARDAYKQAKARGTAEKAPQQMLDAQDALFKADKAYEDGKKSYIVADLAYAAERKAQLAEVSADTEEAKKATDKSARDYVSAQNQMQLQQSKAELKKTKGELARSQQEISQMQSDMAKLAAVSSVKQEARGVVVTLSGSVLFASGKSDLLPSAERKLDEVSKVLNQDQNSRLVVEGYTDSTGSDALNMNLSQKRAESVRSYLVSRGFPSSMIDARGMGKMSPVASNSTAEGRANNRRVEIVIQNQNQNQNQNQ
ncbi:MAG: OmpA family protein [Myxococcota bacterium]